MSNPKPKNPFQKPTAEELGPRVSRDAVALAKRESFVGLARGINSDPDFAWEWHNNIATSIKKELKCSEQDAHWAAARVMVNTFSVDTSKHPEFPAHEEAPKVDTSATPAVDLTAPAPETEDEGLTLTVTIKGHRQSDLDEAILEVSHLVREGFNSGFDENETGSFTFETTGEEIIVNNKLDFTFKLAKKLKEAEVEFLTERIQETMDDCQIEGSFSVEGKKIAVWAEGEIEERDRERLEEKLVELFDNEGLGYSFEWSLEPVADED